MTRAAKVEAFADVKVVEARDYGTLIVEPLDDREGDT